MRKIDLQLFADAGTLVNATANYVNAYDATEVTAFDADAGESLTPTMKTYYDTELLENARGKLVFAQLGKKQGLPRGRGKTMEWRKWKTLDKATTPLSDGIIPTGKKMGQTAITATIDQYGDYVAVSDQLELHAIDNVILGATAELGAAAGATEDTVIRNELLTGTNVMYCDAVDTTTGDAFVGTVATRATLTADEDAMCKLTPDMVNKAVTFLKKQKAPDINGYYVAVIHPSVAYDLRNSAEWKEFHKYADVAPVFNGEIGTLHRCRFIESTEAPVIIDNAGDPAVYATLFFGKDAFGVVDPEGAGMEMILHSKGEIGGPLNQFSTIGYKFSDATAILYEERMVRVESTSTYSAVDEAN